MVMSGFILYLWPRGEMVDARQGDILDVARFGASIEQGFVDRLRILRFPRFLFFSDKLKALWLIGEGFNLITFTNSIWCCATAPAGAFIERGWHGFSAT